MSEAGPFVAPAIQPCPLSSDSIDSHVNPGAALMLVPTSFEELLTSTALPPPGLDHFTARRKLWLTPIPGKEVNARPIEHSAGRQKLFNLLNLGPESLYAWNHGVHYVWTAIMNGTEMTQRLALSAAIKIIHAGWLRDETWPPGVVPPESDEVLKE